MASNLLKKLALGIMIGGSAIFGFREAKAAPVNWSSFSQVVPYYNENENVNYTTTVNLNGVAPSQNMSLVFYELLDDGWYYSIAGFDVQAGSNVGNGYFVRDIGFGDGLLGGESLNSGEAPNGFWDVVFDSNNDGNFGLVDNGYVTRFDANERLNNYTDFSIGVSGLPAFPFNNHSQSGGIINVNYIPESSSLTLLALGAGALALRRRKAKDITSNLGAGPAPYNRM